MQAKLFLSIQSVTERVSYYRSLFEYNYYKIIRYNNTDTRSKINFTTAIISSAFIGYIFNILLTTWKPMYQWSVIEFVGIGYFSFNRGYWLCENTHAYLENVSNNPSSIPREGGSYFNPIDLTTMDMAEEREALEALRMLSEEKNTSFDKQIKTE